MRRSLVRHTLVAGTIVPVLLTLVPSGEPGAGSPAPIFTRLVDASHAVRPL